MAPSVKLPIPAGKLGVVFTGSPPTVKSLVDDSPMLGKVKEGYVVEKFVLPDGEVFENLSTKDLIEALKDSADEEGRFLVLKMDLPVNAEIVLPEGELGIKIETYKGYPTITGIHADSPLHNSLRIGFVVDKLSLSDGTIVTGYSAEELVVLLAGDKDSSFRQITLINPEKVPPSSRSTIVPSYKEVELPTGKLGVKFKGSRNALVSSILPDSPLQGKFREGMIAAGLKMPNGVEYSGFGAVDLTDALRATGNIPGRIMVLRGPDADDLPIAPSIKVYLPEFGNAKELSIKFKGSPAKVYEVLKASPLMGKVSEGQVVLGLDDNSGKVYQELDADALVEAIADTSGINGRALILEGGPPEMMDEFDEDGDYKT